jgi:hypothetical protein
MTMRWNFPITAIVTLVVIGVIVETAFMYHGKEMSQASYFLWNACFAYSVVLWVERDRKSKNISTPLDYQAFVFFLWPFVTPYYLFQTRGWRGLGQGIGLFLFACLPSLAAITTYSIVWEGK